MLRHLSKIKLSAKMFRFIKEKHIISVGKCLSTSPVFFSICVKSIQYYTRHLHMNFSLKIFFLHEETCTFWGICIVLSVVFRGRLCIPMSAAFHSTGTVWLIAFPEIFLCLGRSEKGQSWWSGSLKGKSYSEFLSSSQKSCLIYGKKKVGSFGKKTRVAVLFSSSASVSFSFFAVLKYKWFHYCLWCGRGLQHPDWSWSINMWARGS